MPEKSSMSERSLRQVKEAVLETFAHEDVCVFLFGSRTRGDPGRSSDIGIGILPLHPYDKKS
ncbi:MAG: hypothetical protein JW705_09175 [Methanosarcinaceae archaeon]|nr:hypothetical protein [Methanosarcinaceae archaeon]